MWVAFAFWTVFTGSSFKDKIKGLIGMACAFFTTFFTQKKESKVENSQEEIVENKTEEEK